MQLLKQHNIMGNVFVTYHVIFIRYEVRIALVVMDKDSNSESIVERVNFSPTESCKLSLPILHSFEARNFAPNDANIYINP